MVASSKGKGDCFGHGVVVSLHHIGGSDILELHVFVLWPYFVLIHVFSVMYTICEETKLDA